MPTKQDKGNVVLAIYFMIEVDNKMLIINTVVWEKLVVGNIHEKKTCGKKNLS